MSGANPQQCIENAEALLLGPGEEETAAWASARAELALGWMHLAHLKTEAPPILTTGKEETR